VIHGAYWHNSFGTPYSHGCVNLPSDQAKKLYDWAHIGTTVVVRD
jgi:lipoprotein-anchoring transpeptidase ErfK/SrfK